jgi:TPR repeat protein
VLVFLPWYPIAGGKLLKPDQPTAKKLAEIAARHGASIAQLSLGWLQRSPVMLPIPSTSVHPKWLTLKKYRGGWARAEHGKLGGVGKRGFPIVGSGQKRSRMIAPSEYACACPSNHPPLSASKEFDAPPGMDPR